MILECTQIQELIPQRYPFIMIDRVLELVPGKYAVAIKNVSMNEGFMQGHFPAKAIMPGALILEAMAQTAIVLFAIEKKSSGNTNKPLYYFGSAKARFLHPAVPGDQMTIRVENIKSLPTGAFVSGEAFVDGKKITEAELVFSVRNE
jgi:3-hydroxyacyl-[acyl-carrier-protein] dehydratase